VLVVPLLLAIAFQLAPPKPIETPHLILRLASERPGAPPVSRVMTLVIDVTPKPKMHVYAPQQKDYIPVSITLDANPAFTPHGAVFPKPEKLFFEPLKEMQLVYSKPFRIVQNVRLLPPHSDVDEIIVTGKLRYQACDDAICYLPKDVPVSWTIRSKSAPVQ